MSQLKVTKGFCLCKAVQWETTTPRAEFNLAFSYYNDIKKHCPIERSFCIFLPKYQFTIAGPVKCYTATNPDHKFIHYYWCNNYGTNIGHEKETDNERIHISTLNLENYGKLFHLRPGIAFDGTTPHESMPYTKKNPTAGNVPPMRALVDMPFPMSQNGLTVMRTGYVFDKAPTDS